MTGAHWEGDRDRFAPGDTLLFYTDGVTDTPAGGERFGEERLLAARRDAPADPSPMIAGRADERCASFRSATSSTIARCSVLQLVGVGARAQRRRAGSRQSTGVGELSHGADGAGEVERLELRTQATPAAVPGVRRAVVDFAELHGVGIAPDVALAVSEAITNAVLHAYRDHSAGPVRVVACAEPDRLVVVVRDYGCG